MSVRFHIEHTNIIAYLMDRNQTTSIPPIKKKTLLGFLDGLIYHTGQSEDGLFQLRNASDYLPDTQLIADNYSWVLSIKNAAIQCYCDIDSNCSDLSNEDIINKNIVFCCFERIKTFFDHFTLLALFVGDFRLYRQLVFNLAERTGNRLLLLLPDTEGEEGHSLRLNFLNPLPAVRLLTGHPEKWPGVLLWNRLGVCRFFSLKEFDKIIWQTDYFASYDSLSLGRMSGMDFQQGWENTNYLCNPVETLLENLPSFCANGRPAGKRIIHLSDLHFGESHANENQAMLHSHLERIGLEVGVDRFVITGDMVQKPTRSNFNQFKKFYEDLKLITPDSSPILIPGNHDQKKFFGSIQRDIIDFVTMLPDLSVQRLVVDDRMQCVFAGFDSSLEGDLSRGRVSENQFRDMGVAINKAFSRNSQVEKYLFIALLHHHPVSFDQSLGDDLLSRLLNRVGIRQEDFLRMENGDDFLQWCVRRKIPLVLHGHKHVPRHYRKAVQVNPQRPDETREVEVIGCGTSLGSGNRPLCYTLITWHPESRCWSHEFFLDQGDNSGFQSWSVNLIQVSDEPQGRSPP